MPPSAPPPPSPPSATRESRTALPPLVFAPLKPARREAIAPLASAPTQNALSASLVETLHSSAPSTKLVMRLLTVLVHAKPFPAQLLMPMQIHHALCKRPFALLIPLDHLPVLVLFAIPLCKPTNALLDTLATPQLQTTLPLTNALPTNAVPTLPQLNVLSIIKLAPTACNARTLHATLLLVVILPLVMPALGNASTPNAFPV
jgi:hypothetical protein